MTTEGIIHKVIRKWVEWEGLDKNVDLLDVEQDLIAEIKKARVSKYQPYVFIADMLGTESETKE